MTRSFICRTLFRKPIRGWAAWNERHSFHLSRRSQAMTTDAQRELAEDEQALLERQLLRVQMLLDAGTPPVVAVT